MNFEPEKEDSPNESEDIEDAYEEDGFDEIEEDIASDEGSGNMDPV